MAEQNAQLTTFYRGWTHPDLKLHAEIPFKITLSLGFIPSVGVDLERLRKDLRIFWEKLQGGKLDKVITVEECVNEILRGELKENDEVAVAAFLPKAIPKKITQYPSFSSAGSDFLVTLEKNAGIYCPEIGREFFDGVTSNFVYLAETLEYQAYFVRAYFPSAEVPPQYLRTVSNLGALVYGRLRNTALPYPCRRNSKKSNSVVIESFSHTLELGIMVHVMYFSRPIDTSTFLKQHGLEKDTEKFLTWADDRFQTFWLYQRI